MASEPIRILHVDDYAPDRALVRDALEREHGGFAVSAAATLQEFETALSSGEFDLVLSDFNILDFEGLDVIRMVQAARPELPVIVVTGTGTEEIAVESLKLGASDYVIKTAQHIRRLPAAIRTVLDNKRLESEKRRTEKEREVALEELQRLKKELEHERDYLREEIDVVHNSGEIVGESRGLKQVLAKIEAVAQTNASVLILGESGTGKELVARALHSQSPRASSSLVKVNCASIPGELFESEFFGHVKGAFTGAHRDRIGRFQLANGGTIFLDEVAEIPLALQGKLLRVLQEGEFERVGEDVTRRVDVRVIAATNRDLEERIEQSAFREDLYYRLSVFPIAIPPLRERRDDIVPLASHFLRSVCRQLDRPGLALNRRQAEVLEEYGWPGNARELRNVVERAAILSPGGRLRLERALPDSGPLSAMIPPPGEEGSGAEAARRFVTVEELKRRERVNLAAALEYAGWKVSGSGGAAELLGIKPSALSYKIKALGIRKPS